MCLKGNTGRHTHCLCRCAVVNKCVLKSHRKRYNYLFLSTEILAHTTQMFRMFKEKCVKYSPTLIKLAFLDQRSEKDRRSWVHIVHFHGWIFVWKHPSQSPLPRTSSYQRQHTNSQQQGLHSAEERLTKT